MRRFLRDVSTVVRKDLRIELRARDVLLSMALFSLLEVVVFSFAFHTNEDRARAYAPGIIWVSVLFAASLGLARLFDRERENSAIDGNLLSPLSPIAFYVAKLFSSVLFTLAMVALAVPLVFLFFSLSLPSPGPLIVALVLGTVGFVAVQTLFAAALGGAKMRDLLLPLVVYPLVVPLVIAGVKITGVALSGRGFAGAMDWLQFMAGYDALFVPLSAWLFGRLAELGD